LRTAIILETHKPLALRGKAKPACTDLPAGRAGSQNRRFTLKQVFSERFDMKSDSRFDIGQRFFVCVALACSNTFETKRVGDISV
jgi:hypothetical protein